MTAGPETATIKIVPLPGKTVGHIGLGAMGRPIAQNFVASGQSTVVFDADTTSQERFLAGHTGIRGAAGPADFADCDIVVLVLPTSDIVDSVVLSDDGLLKHLRPGSTIIDMGRASPRAHRHSPQLRQRRGSQSSIDE